MSTWTGVSGINEGYVLELYERFRQDPASVDAATRAAFERMAPPAPEAAGAAPAVKAPPPAAAGPLDAAALRRIVGAVNLAESIRKYGHLGAQLDPLGTPPWGDPSLAPEAHGISEADLAELPASLIGGPLAEHAASAREAIRALRQVYCSRTGYDYAHIFRPEERVWLRRAAEEGLFRSPHSPVLEEEVLDRITEV